MSESNNLQCPNRKAFLETVWDALSSYREDCIPEGDDSYDEQWNDICHAMACLTEDLEFLEGQKDGWMDLAIAEGRSLIERAPEVKS
jgi:hypothetical protein